MIKIVKQYSHQELLKMPKISCANSYESDTDNIVKVNYLKVVTQNRQWR